MFSKSGNRKPENDGARDMPSIIARNLRITGNLESDGDIQVDGVVEGDIKSQRLTISEQATVRGAIDCEEVTIAGTVTGQVRAKAVSLLKDARVVADITQDKLSIESGAFFEGNTRHFPKEETMRKVESVSAPTLLRKVAGSDISGPRPLPGGNDGADD